MRKLEVMVIFGDNANNLRALIAAFACRALFDSYNAALPALIG
jgi:hypothetical protein